MDADPTLAFSAPALAGSEAVLVPPPALEHPDAPMEGTADADSPPLSPRVRRRIPWRTVLIGAILPVLLLLAATVRLIGIEWDDGFHLHPDERFIIQVTVDRIGLPWDANANLLDPRHSRWNVRAACDPARPNDPCDFAYGSLPVYFLKLTAWAITPVATFVDQTIRHHPTPPPGSYDGLLRVGRVLSALFDVVTVLATYLLAKELFNRRAGLVAAALMVVFPIQVQLAHFFATDSVATTFVTLTLLQAVRVSKGRDRWTDLALLGVLGAAAVASKAAAAPIALPMGLAVWVATRSGGPFKLFTRPFLLGLVAVGIAGFLAYALFEPYVIMDPASMLRDVSQEGAMVRGAFVPPYTEQYLDTPPVLYELNNYFRWVAGPVLVPIMLLGLGWGLVGSLRGNTRYWILLAWLVPFLAITLSFQVKFIRYLEPGLPAMVALGAVGLVHLWQLRGTARVIRGIRWASAAAFVAALITSGAITLGLLHTWTTEHTRVAASRWMLTNIPPGAVISNEGWDDTLPLSLPNVQQRSFQTVTFNNYDRDTPAKRQQLIANIQRADYIVLSSARLSAVITRLASRYPVTSAFYPDLDNGSLGFQKVEEFKSWPTVLGWSLDDDHADESWSVYDHPQVEIYKKVDSLTAAQLDAVLPPAPPQAQLDAAWATTGTAAPKVAMLSSAAVAAIAAAGTFTSEFPLSSMPGAIDVILWLLVAEIAGLVLWPLVARVFSGFPDRGYGLAKPLGVLVLGYVPWALTGFLGVPYSPWIARAWFLVLAIGGGALLWRRRQKLLPALHRHSARLLTVESVFLVGFVLFLVIRLMNPDLWHPARGGEKPMDLAYLTAVAKSATLPPYDPWLGGAPMNYYYFGQALVATLLRITGIPPTIGFNLAIPLWFGLCAASVFSIGWALARRVAGGFAAVLLVMFTSNLTSVGPIARLVATVPQGQAILPPGTTPDQVLQMSWLQQAYYALRAVPLLETGTIVPPTDLFWAASRVTPGGIDEFPFFSFLFADLHAHVLALPLALLTVGCCVAYVLRPPRGFINNILLFAVWGLALGSLGPANSWDLPSLGALSLGAIVVGHLVHPRARSIKASTLSAAFLAVLTFGLYRPFSAHFVNPEATNPSTPLDGLIDAMSGKIKPVQALFAPYTPIQLNANANEHGNLQIYLLLFGLFWLACGVYALLALYRQKLPSGLRRDALLLLLVAAGTVAALLPEWLVIGDHMNTVFKFHFQAWYLLGLPAAVALVRLPDLLRFTFNWGREHTRLVWAPLAAALVLGLLYPVTSVGPRVRDRFDGTQNLGLTLDGTDYMTVAIQTEKNQPFPLAPDRQAIEWLQQNVSGTPRILEAAMDPYRWGSRVAIYTGLPTVFGWQYHQQQQLGNEVVSQRQQQAAAVWTDPNDAQLLQRLRDLGVNLVYLGPLETIVEGQASVDHFKRLEGSGLTPIYNANGVTILQVDPASGT